MSERLEEIKDRRKNYRPDVLPIWFEDMDWLIKQAEEVERLKGLEESLRQNIKIKQEGIDFLKQENERYREALEFYAGRKNWVAASTSIGFIPSLVEYDQGERARQALESDNE